MANNDGSPTLKLWQIVIGQVPWFLTILALGAWQASKFDTRLAGVEGSVKRIEAKLEQAQAEKIQEMTEELRRLRVR